MKHGDFLCFVTRIVEKSWKNRGRLLSSVFLPFLLKHSCVSVENRAFRDMPPPPVWYVPSRRNPQRSFASTIVETGTFSTIFPRSEVKNCILTAIVELKHPHKGKDDGPVAPFDATGPAIHTVSLLAVSLSTPSFGFQRKSIRPRRQLAHQLAQLLNGTETI